MAGSSRRSTLSLLLLTAGVGGGIGAVFALYLTACELSAQGYTPPRPLVCL